MKRVGVPPSPRLTWPAFGKSAVDALDEDVIAGPGDADAEGLEGVEQAVAVFGAQRADDARLALGERGEYVGAVGDRLAAGRG